MTGPWAIVVLTLLGLALRLLQLDGQAVWIDETASLRNAIAYGTGGIARLVAVDHVAPLHSILMWYAVKIGGMNAIAMRLPSVIAGTLTIPAIYWTARRMLADVRVAILAAALVAISPFAVWYAQEARMYALLLLCATIFVPLSWAALDRRLGWGEMIALTLVTATGIYTHQYMVLLSASFGFFLLVRRGPSGLLPTLRSTPFWHWVTTQIAAAILFTPWLVVTLHQANAYSGLEKPAILLWTPYTLFTFVAGLSYGPSVLELHAGAGSAMRHHVIGVGLVALATGILLAFALAALWRIRAWRRGGFWFVLWLVLPMAMAIGVTFVSHIQYNVRYVIICFPALMILLAIGIAQMLRRSAARWIAGGASLLLVGSMMASLVQWYADPRYAKEELRPLARLIAEAPDDVLLVSDNDRVAPVLAFYGAPLRRGPLGPDDAVAGQAPADILRMLDASTRARSPREIWLIGFRSWEIDPAARVRGWIEQRAPLIEQRSWPGVSLRRYRTKGTVVNAPNSANRATDTPRGDEER